MEANLWSDEQKPHQAMVKDKTAQQVKVQCCQNLLFRHYKYVYDGQENIVRSIDILGTKEYNYTYEDGRLVRATESDITLSSVLLGNVEFQNKRIVKINPR